MDFEAETAALIETYTRRGGDPESTHAREDDLLEAFVRFEAENENPVALQLIPLLDLKRVRWYA